MYWPISGDEWTDIPVARWLGQDNTFIHLSNFRAISMPNKKEGVFEISFSSGCISPDNKEKSEIINRLMKLNETRKIKLIPNRKNESLFQVIFTINKKEGFTDAAIALAKELVKIFNIISRWNKSKKPDDPEHKKHHVYLASQFIVHQDTWIKKKGEWMTFQKHLCQEHGLPDYFNASKSLLDSSMSLNLKRFYKRLHNKQIPFFDAAEL